MGSCSSKKQIKQVEQPTPLNQGFLAQNQSQRLTIQNFTEYEQMYKLVSLDDLVFKMEEFKVSHPGGPHLIEAIIGKDVGRYLNGSSTEIINGQPAKMFTHPKWTYQALKGHFYAKLNNPQYTMQKKESRLEFIEEQNQYNEGDYEEVLMKTNVDSWVIIAKFQITPDIINLVLSNPDRRIVRNLEELKEKWLYDCGKHFKVIISIKTLKDKNFKGHKRNSDHIDDQYRYYSLVRVLNPQTLQKILNKSSEKKSIKVKQPKQPSETKVQSQAGQESQSQKIAKQQSSLYYNKRQVFKEVFASNDQYIENRLLGFYDNYDYIDLFVKIYREQGYLSQLIDRFYLNEEVQIKGPLGMGLRLNDVWLDSILQKRNHINIIAFSGGMAINAFLDFAYYVINQEDIEGLKYKFRFTLFAAFKSDAELYAKQILLQDYNPKFKCYFYFSRQQSELERQHNKRFNRDFIQEKLPCPQDDVDRVIVRGPAPFENDIRQELLYLGISQETILVL